MADPVLDPTAPVVPPPPAPAPTAQSLMTKAQGFADANKVTPLTNDFNEATSTAGRVKSIIDDNSPLMQQARTSGLQSAAAKGLTNSSLAGQAEQNAVLSAATPIASTDASLYNQNSLANLAAKNQAAVVNAQDATTMGNTALNTGTQAETAREALANSNLQQTKQLAQQQGQFNVTAGQSQQQIDAQIAQFAQSVGLSTADLAIKRDTLTAQQQQFLQNLESQKAIAQLQSSTTLQAAGISADTQKAIAAGSQATQLAVAKANNDNAALIQGNSNIAGAWGSTLNAIAQIQNNPNLEQAAKETLIQNNIQSFQAYATFWQGAQGAMTPNIAALLQFNTGAGGNFTAPTTPGTPGGPSAPQQQILPVSGAGGGGAGVGADGGTGADSGGNGI